MTRFYADLVQNDEPPHYVTRFQILTDERLPFTYSVDKDGYGVVDSDVGGLELAETYNMIKVIERDIPYDLGRFRGGPEPIRNSAELRYVVPSKGKMKLDGEDLDIRDFGEWKCMRCNHVSHVPVHAGKIEKPFECFSDTCGRKGPFTPEFPLNLVRPIWKLPVAPIECTSLDVYNSVYNFCKDYLVLREEEYHIMTLWIMATWLVDDFQTCPYLCAIAPKSSGKTQLLYVLGELAYRAVAAISVTAASLFRAIEMWHITLLIDEAEYQVKQDTEAGQALYGCLNGGYKRGSYAIRVEGESVSKMPATYEVFGFKAIATTKLFHPTLESRAIIINMSQGIPDKILIDDAQASIIRAKLLYWRFETLGKLPIVFPESRNGRLIEMFIPLFTVAQVLKDKEGVAKPITYDDLIALLTRWMVAMERVRKEEERSSSDAQIIEAINTIACKPLLEGLGDREYIKLGEIAMELHWLTDASDEKEARKIMASIGRSLKVMGIPTEHKRYGKVVEHLKPEIADRLAELTERFLGVTDGFLGVTDGSTAAETNTV
jgi:hypothetical protein